MEEKYPLSQERAVPASTLILPLLGTLLVGFGMFAFFMPVEDTRPVYGSLAETVDQYALHLILAGSVFYVINVVMTVKRAIKARKQY
ncbi:hypothetical protein LPB19_01800 [Marinobacter salinisoli]|uniref:Uncharacterized protein n=1 Tax=Marinobacter salinisoli TaxID=2769486 RepID=A0ABX7MSP2_9GAMM|nr:hypothetical protein [Marinobacter salinisoli]QSP95179.1 hypothetical protein LPB19_01800 [Marinobacter salinisoli]